MHYTLLSFKNSYTLVPDVFLEPRESREAVKTNREAARREKPVVTLDLNLTFMQTQINTIGSFDW